MSKKNKHWQSKEPDTQTEDNSELGVVVSESTEPDHPDETKEAFYHLFRVAQGMNGRDHMKLCAFHVVNRSQCDCGLQELRLATKRLEFLHGQK